MWAARSRHRAAVEPVGSAESAREKLVEGVFLAAIIDCVLPRVDGATLAALARERGAAVILMSGEPRAMEALPGCGFHYLEKPFRIPDLLQAVEVALTSDLPSSNSRPAAWRATGPSAQSTKDP